MDLALRSGRPARAGKHYAIKYIRRGTALNKYHAREIVYHASMVHPHVVAFREVFLTEEHLAVVMEYVNGGNMFQYVKRRGSLHEDEGTHLLDCPWSGTRLHMQPMRGLARAGLASSHSVPVPAARWYFQQLMMAVSYCHAMGIVNRDIKVPCAQPAGSSPRTASHGMQLRPGPTLHCPVRAQRRSRLAASMLTDPG